MGTIAQGEITLSAVNDAYTVSLTPASCVINANYDGSDPQLTSTQGNITVKRGSQPVQFHVTEMVKSEGGIGVSFHTHTTDTMPFRLLGIADTTTSGWVDFTIVTDDAYAYTATVRFAFTVVRESAMLDWIQDWETNKTKIGDSYIMTPKMFVGTKEDVVEYVDDPNGDGFVPVWKTGALTGVYIGQDLLGNQSTVGLYGYFQDSEIFHLNAEGGKIGGWNITEAGISISGGRLSILSTGSIVSKGESETPYWALYADGSATFANGNVIFQTNGDASFAGSVTSSSGNIGGWQIASNGLYSGVILIDAASKYIGIAATESWNTNAEGEVISTSASQHRGWIRDTGGLALYWESALSYGLDIYNSSGLIAQLGSTNNIAGWSIDADAIYLGTKNNTQNGYSADGITLGTRGLRGTTWMIDTGGYASFASGNVVFQSDGSASFNGSITANSGSVGGWLIAQNGLYNGPVLIDTVNKYIGIAANASWGMSMGGEIQSTSAITHKACLQDTGGVAMYWQSASDFGLLVHNTSGRVVQLGSTNFIAGWNFTTDALYSGTKNNTQNAFTTGGITIGTHGIRAPKWRLEIDGSGALANGNISWDTDGKVTLDSSVTISWSNISDALGSRLMWLGPTGIYAGQIEASQINADELLSNGQAWALLQDGSGYLASGNITWDTEGTLSVSGEITATSGSIGGIVIGNGYIGIDPAANESSEGVVWENLTLTNNFFKVGGPGGYAMLGQDLIPGSSGGGQTAVGRIVNSHSNTIYTTNYGLLIDVTDGAKNFGVSSNAPLIAPSFINTHAKVISFSSSGSYTMDFSQNNVFILYYNEDGYSGTSVTLPSESQIAQYFGYQSVLPLDFATIVVFHVSSSSLPIVLNNVYDSNGTLTNYQLNPSTSAMVLIYKDRNPLRCTYKIL